MMSIAPTDPDPPSTNCGMQGVDQWEMAVIGRPGQPPLRFRGRRVAHLERVVTHDLAVFVELWARKKGDVVIVYSDVLDSSARSRAVVLSDVTDVANHLEAVCLSGAVPGQNTAFPGLLADVVRARAHQQQFAILVGDFLAELAPPLADKPTLSVGNAD